MRYRRVDVTLPPDDDTDLLDLCSDDIEVIDSVEVTGLDGRRAVAMLMDASHVEGLLDKLETRFDGNEKFRANVMEVLATLPPHEPEDEADDGVEGQNAADTDEDDDAKKRFGRISRNELLEDLRPGTNIDTLYMSQVFLSAVIAAGGLVKDSPAVVIGAMVIAPLLIPNMSLALATTLGDFKMGVKSLATNAAGLSLALGFAVLVGLLLPFDPGVGQIASRTSADYLDVVLALAAGAAGAMAVTSGVSANLIGVMVAVALLPPLVAFGLLLGQGEFMLARGAGLLTGINVACVNVAATATFLIRGIRPNRWYEKERARRATIASLAVWLLVLAGTLLLIWWMDFDPPGVAG
ncbi:MAG: TIGR00341 family protein [Planctomycetota bacterium]